MFNLSNITSNHDNREEWGRDKKRYLPISKQVPDYDWSALQVAGKLLEKAATSGRLGMVILYTF